MIASHRDRYVIVDYLYISLYHIASLEMVKIAHENHNFLGLSSLRRGVIGVFQARYPDGLSGGAFFGSDSGRGRTRW